MTYIKTIVTATMLMSLTACFTNPHTKTDRGQQIDDLWRGNSTTTVSKPGQHGYYPSANNRLGEYTRTEKNELDQLFPELHNPNIYIYSFPHISKSGLPVPGYTTVIKMYPNSVNYALPGEEPIYEQ